MKKNVIIQDNALTAARYEMTALEKNILYAVMAQIEDTDLPNKCYKISTHDIADSKGARIRRDYFNEAISKLLTREIMIKKSDGNLLQVTVIASAEHDKDGIGIEIEISNKIRPYLFALKKNFTIFGLEIATSLNSKYSKRMYEMLCQFRSTGIFRLSIQELKDRFQLIDENGNEQYERWSSFEKCILKTAQNEINEKADFQFDYELKKKGRKVVGVEFRYRKVLEVNESIQLQPQIKALSPEENDKYNRLIDRISQPPFSLSKPMIDKVLKWEYAEPRPTPSVWKHIATARDTALIDNRGAYLLTLLGIK